jgi:uridylate kinase
VWLRKLKIVIKIGGYAFPLETDVNMISEYANLLKKLRKEGHDIVAVTGGGENARKYIESARKLGGTESFCDMIGIQVSRLNAYLLITKLNEDAYPSPPININELVEALTAGKIVVLGGLQPGQSTNAVAAIAAEAIRAHMLINTTDVDGVYTADPKKDPKAKKIPVITVNELFDIVSRDKIFAGSYKLFDLSAVKIIERSKIPTWIVDGRNVKNVLKVVNGEKVGTQIIIDK